MPDTFDPRTFIVPSKLIVTFVILQPNGDEIEYQTQEQAHDALQYYPQGKLYIKSVTMEEALV